MLQVGDESREVIWEMAERLFPIHRSLAGPGVVKLLNVIKGYLEIGVLEYPSGQEVFDWIVPEEWELRSLRVYDESDRKVVDFEDHNLHAPLYCTAFSGVVDREEFLRHVHTCRALPDAIPCVQHYYRRNWGICLSENAKRNLQGQRFRVEIDASFTPGKLRMGEMYLPGESDEEVLFTSYFCHPSQANDNVSGMVVTIELFRLLARLKKRRFSYRLLIVPETIGSIAWLYHHRDQARKIVGGWALACCGDSGRFTYVRSFAGDSLTDRVSVQALRRFSPPADIRNFVPLGGDNRQFNAPGFRIPVGLLMRTPLGEYREYHSSSDDLSFIHPEKLVEALELVLHFVYILEHNRLYKNRYQTEPFFDRYNAYIISKEYMDRGWELLTLIQEIDGTRSLLEIAERTGISFEEVVGLADYMRGLGFVESTDGARGFT